MAIQEFLNKLKVKNTDKLSAIEVEAQALKADVTEIETQETEYAAELKAAEEKGFEEGLAQAGQAGGEGKIYSDAEVNQIIVDIKAPLEARIAELELGMSNLQSQVDGFPTAVNEARAEAIATYKQEVLAAYQESRAKENEVEDSFESRLK